MSEYVKPRKRALKFSLYTYFQCNYILKMLVFRYLEVEMKVDILQGVLRKIRTFQICKNLNFIRIRLFHVFCPVSQNKKCRLYGRFVVDGHICYPFLKEMLRFLHFLAEADNSFDLKISN